MHTYLYTRCINAYVVPLLPELRPAPTIINIVAGPTCSGVAGAFTATQAHPNCRAPEAKLIHDPAQCEPGTL